MFQFRTFLTYACIGAALSGCGGETDADAPNAAPPEIADQLPAGSTELGRRTIRFPNGTYTRVKFESPDGSVGVLTFDEDGQRVERLPNLPAQPLGDLLAQRLEDMAPDNAIDVTVYLPKFAQSIREGDESGEVGIDDGERSYRIEDEVVDEARALEQTDRAVARFAERADRRRAHYRSLLERLAERAELTDRQPMIDAIRRGERSIDLTLTPLEIRVLLDQHGPAIESIVWRPPIVSDQEAGDEGSCNDIGSPGGTDWYLDALGIEPTARNNGANGQEIGLYMREADNNCPIDGDIAGDYLRLSGASDPDSHACKVAHVLRTIAPDATLYCGNASPAPADPTTPADDAPPILVASHSWSYYLSPSSDTGAYLTYDRDFDDYAYENGVVVFKSAGNAGSDRSDYVSSPGRGFNILSVGAYNDDFTMRSSSLFTDPANGNRKPEIAATGDNLETPYGSLSATSGATPSAAGTATDLLSDVSWFKGRQPAVRAFMMATAVDNIEGDATFSDKDGAGGVNYRNGKAFWCWHKRGSASSMQAGDTIIKTRSLKKNARHRAVLAWMVRGTYAHGAQGDSGIDFDLTRQSSSQSAQARNDDSAFEILGWQTGEQKEETDLEVQLVRKDDADVEIDVALCVFSY